MTALRFGLSDVLPMLAGLHLLWGLRIWWPIRDEPALARTVVGSRGTRRMPHALACHGVAAALGAVAAGLWVTASAPVLAGLTACCVVFLCRGLVTYTPLAGVFAVEQPFVSNDRMLYAPLCLLIAAVLAIMIGAELK